MEATSKDKYIDLVIDNLLQLQDISVDVVDWLEKSKALIPDESKAIQELKAALVESLQREEGLRAKLTYSAAAELEAEFRVVEKKLAESIKREAVLEQKLAASMKMEWRLGTHIGHLYGIASETEVILGKMRDIVRDRPTPLAQDLVESTEPTSPKHGSSNTEPVKPRPLI